MKKCVPMVHTWYFREIDKYIISLCFRIRAEPQRCVFCFTGLLWDWSSNRYHHYTVIDRTQRGMRLEPCDGRMVPCNCPLPWKDRDRLDINPEDWGLNVCNFLRRKTETMIIVTETVLHARRVRPFMKKPIMIQPIAEDSEPFGCANQGTAHCFGGPSSAIPGWRSAGCKTVHCRVLFFLV
jgi:hypothetical protein